jgi:hypothetical protein
MTAALAQAPAPADSLGPYASFIESQPVAALALTGAAVGFGIGTVFGLMGFLTFGGSPLGWVVKSGGVWGAAGAILGATEGGELQQWLASSNPSP